MAHSRMSKYCGSVPVARVPQLSLPKTACTPVALPGAPSATDGHSRAMASTSARTRVCVFPQPMDMPPRFIEPALTKSIFDPIAAICCCTCSRAPWPKATMAITAPTPIMIPSMVRPERSLLRASARNASRIVARNSDKLHDSVFEHGHVLQHDFGKGPLCDGFVFAYCAIAKHDCPLGEMGDVRFVSDQHNRQPAFLI